MSGEKAKQFKKVFDFNGRNPDVLNSIANLSNDEVFTPPEFANQMLETLEKAWADSNDGENIWANSQVKFLDPFTKSGVFLREIAVRLIDGLQDEFPDLQERVDHILTKQVFGIATTRLTALMARRTLYCSKKANGKFSITNKFNDENGNIWFEPLEHTWIGGKIKEVSMDKDGNEIEITKDGRCKYCGAPKNDFTRDDGLELHAYGLIHNDNPKEWVEEVFGKNMKFDVIIGNPPYQIEDGGYSASAAPIYDEFVEKALQLDARCVVMVIPARWYAGGKGLDSFRFKMLNSKNIKYLVDFPDSSKVFPGVEIKGGVCFFAWDKSHEGPAEISTFMPDGTVLKDSRLLKTPGVEVLIRFPIGTAVIEKIQKIHDGDGETYLKVPEKLFMKRVSASKPFGLRTNFRGTDNKDKNSLVLFQNGGRAYIPRDEIQVGVPLIDTWKIFISSAYGAGNTYPHSILGTPFLGRPGEVCTETYMVIGPFETEMQAKSALSYIKTRFFRFLVMLHKPAQHATRSVYSLVPDQVFDKLFTDEFLFDYYEFSEEERGFVESTVREMSLD